MLELRCGAVDGDKLLASVDALDPVLALLSLVHMTGDRLLLSKFGHAFDGVQRRGQASFRPQANVAEKVVDPAIVAEIRQRLVAALESNPAPLLREPDRALFRKMADFAIGKEVDDAALAMGREQAGFCKDEGALEATRVPSPEFKVLVLGAGMIGINAAVKLKAAGFAFQVIEKRREVGGTWSVNTFPNAAVDTSSVQYSYSFEQNSSWTKYYPRGPEYLSYLKYVAEKYGLLEYIDFDTALKSAVWDDGRRIWKVICTRGDEEKVYEANAVISAFGFLNRPSFPDISDLDRFSGPVLHSARWDDGVELEGKKVVVVGAGATAAQVVTGVATRAAHLTVIQRQPNYLLPDPNVLADVEANERWCLENIPYVTQWARFQSLTSLMTFPHSLGSIDPDWRAKTGGVSALNDGARQACLSYIAAKFADRPDLQEKVTPDFPFMAKRPILDCGYYDTLKRDNVLLVEGALVACDEDTAILSDGTRIACDVLILATGYKLDFLAGFDVRGRSGRTLNEAWTPYPYAYLGVEVPDFPNFFVSSGPNSGLTASHTTLGEQQVHYIVEALKLMVEHDLAAIEVKQDVCAAYCDRLYERLENTVFVQSGTAHGYYRHESGKIVLAYPGTNVEYWSALRRPLLADHRLTLSDRESREALESAELALS